MKKTLTDQQKQETNITRKAKTKEEPSKNNNKQEKNITGTATNKKRT